MWRWIIRIYVAFVIFVFLLFLFGAGLLQIDHVLVRFGFLLLHHLMREYMLVTMFLLGVCAGQVYLGTNVTGQGWFSARDGSGYEGFRVEELKPWTWAIGSPFLLAGIIFWFGIQMENSGFAQVGWQSFYRGFLAPECSSGKIFGIDGNLECSIHVMFLGTWMAAVGYSFAPAIRMYVRGVYRRLKVRAKS
jgi:hypothetical protein